MCACLELMHGPIGQIICGERDIFVMEKNKLLMPPLWNTYFSWGYYDNTCSFGNYTTEKVLIHVIHVVTFFYQCIIWLTDFLKGIMACIVYQDFAVWEGLSDWGEAVCAACPNSNIIITAGNSTVVCVWDVSIRKDKLKYMKLKQVRHPIMQKHMLIPRNGEKKYHGLLLFSLVTSEKEKKYMGWIWNFNTNRD